MNIIFFPTKTNAFAPKKNMNTKFVVKKTCWILLFVKQYVGYQVFVPKKTLWTSGFLWKKQCIKSDCCLKIIVFSKKIGIPDGLSENNFEYPFFLPKNNFEYRFFAKKTTLNIIFFFRNTYWLSDFLFLIIFSISLFVNTQHVFSSKWVSCIPTAGRNTCFFPSHAG